MSIKAPHPCHPLYSGLRQNRGSRGNLQWWTVGGGSCFRGECYKAVREIRKSFRRSLHAWRDGVFLEQFCAGVRVNKFRGGTFALEGPRDVYKARRVHRVSHFTSHIANDLKELDKRSRALRGHTSFDCCVDEQGDLKNRGLAVSESSFSGLQMVVYVFPWFFSFVPACLYLPGLIKSFKNLIIKTAISRVQGLSLQYKFWEHNLLQNHNIYAKTCLTEDFDEMNISVLFESQHGINESLCTRMFLPFNIFFCLKVGF